MNMQTCSTLDCGLPCDAGCQAVGSGADAARREQGIQTLIRWSISTLLELVPHQLQLGVLLQLELQESQLVASNVNTFLARTLETAYSSCCSRSLMSSRVSEERSSPVYLLMPVSSWSISFFIRVISTNICCTKTRMVIYIACIYEDC